MTLVVLAHLFGCGLHEAAFSLVHRGRKLGRVRREPSRLGAKWR